MSERSEPRVYWSRRQGHTANLSVDQGSRLFASLISSLEERGYLQQWFGYECVDSGDVAGLAGSDRAGYALRKTLRDGLWRPQDNWSEWTLDDLLTAVEFFFDHVSKPEATGYAYHEYMGCGWHYQAFDTDAGRQSYRAEVNELLQHVEDGWELSVRGEIVHRAPSGLDELLKAPLPTTGGRYEALVMSAIRKFRARTSTPEDRRDAVRDLADALELLRPDLVQVLSSKDEGDLFNLANNFGVRHMNTRQKLDYDGAIWLSWMFYFYLSTIHAATRLIAKRSSAATSEDVVS